MKDHICILIVDADEKSQTFISTLLGAYELTIWQSRNTDEALKALDEHRFGLILLDLAGNAVDPYSVLRFMKKRKITTPVIALTDRPVANEHLDASLVRGVVRKPLIAGELIRPALASAGKKIR
ncbi:MAG: response regulator [Acidobacteriota bacterium]